MSGSDPRPYVPYVVFTVMLWAVLLPGILILDADRGLPLRQPVAVALAAAIGLAGIALVNAGSRHLAAAGIRLFGVRPGGLLVTDGLYRRLRNPIDVGTTMIALATWLALDLELGWVIPAGALASFVAGVGPYEDRLLLEEFGDEFKQYRRAVPKWRVRSTSDS